VVVKWMPRIFTLAWYCVHVMFIVVSHLPTTRAFDFLMLIFAPDASPYWSNIFCILGMSLGDCKSIVTSSAYAEWVPLLPTPMRGKVDARARMRSSIQHAQGTSLSHRPVDGDFARRMSINIKERCRILVHTSYVLLE
jgi:hypothetical protein